MYAIGLLLCIVPAAVAVVDRFGFWNTGQRVSATVILMLFVFQIILVVATHTNSMIHDVFAVTVVVDLSSQKIFDTAEEMLDYKKRIHAEKASRKDY